MFIFFTVFSIFRESFFFVFLFIFSFVSFYFYFVLKLKLINQQIGVFSRWLFSTLFDILCVNTTQKVYNMKKNFIDFHLLIFFFRFLYKIFLFVGIKKFYITSKIFLNDFHLIRFFFVLISVIILRNQ